MDISKTPHYQFTREDKSIICWFQPSPLKSKEGGTGCVTFRKECSTEMEAVLLHDYLSEFYWRMKKDFFTEGYNAHKKREKNWML